MLVLDNSRSYYSRELISHFKNSPWFNSVEVIDNPQQLKDGIEHTTGQYCPGNTA